MKKVSVFLGLMALSLPLYAEVSANVPTFNPAYQYWEKLEALGCAYPTLRGLGPQSFIDMRAAVDWDPSTTACEAPAWLLDERQLLLRPLPAVELRGDGFAAVDDKVTLPRIPATLWPLFPLRQNRPTVNGGNLSTEATTATSLEVGGVGIALGVTPGVFTGWDAQTSFHGSLYLQEGYVRVGYGFSEITFGRYSRQFGDTRHGSLLFSGATAPLTVLEYTLRPMVPGGLFSFLGPVTVRTWAANQGSAALSNATLWGVEFGLRPFHWWEWELVELFQFGGAGAPTLQTGEVLSQVFLGGGSGLAGRRNAAVALNTSLWGPEHWAKAYGQVLIERVGDGVTPPFSYLAGLWLPKLQGWDVRFEYVLTDPNSYQNPTWTQGLTYDGSTLGHPLGPDGEGAYIDVGLPPIFTWWHPEVGVLYENRNRIPTGGNSPSTRYGVWTTVERRWGLANLQLKLAFHQVHNPNYQAGLINNVLGVGAVFRYTFLY